MKDKIQAQIHNINAAIGWLKANKPELADKQSLTLIDERRKLRRLAEALEDNPAIAAFGKSQVGKSYLMNCILQNKKTGRPFMVTAGDKEYDFINQINPIGDGKEATGVVTRFSSFRNHPGLYSPDYPVLMRPVSVKDLLLIICDTYFNDFDDATTYTEKEITDKCEAFRQQYASFPAQDKPVLSGDDLLDIREYFGLHIHKAHIFTTATAYFNRLALFIDRVPETEYIRAFSLLWHDEPAFNRLFDSCMSVLRALRFSRYVYLPIEAVLHEGKKDGTIMSVECLKRFYASSAVEAVSEVYLRENDRFISIGKLTKSQLCAVCAEVDFHIPETFLEGTDHYNTAAMPAESRGKLGDGSVSMAILKDNDLLDFPGARARGGFLLSALSGNDDTLMYCFLRGKVANLFNMYNEGLHINVLLFSHHDQDNDVTNLWQLVQSWVHNYVGKSPEARAKTLQGTGGISPFFFIATMFNRDMGNSVNDAVGDNESSIKNRWTGRFENVVLGQVFHASETDWVNNWTAPGSKFRNSYLLRDFKFSDNLYIGFKATGQETGFNIGQGFTQTYYDRLRSTFIGSDTVASLFQDPALSWDVAATMGNTGALYIISRLSEVAACMKTMRQAQFEDLMGEAVDKVYGLMDVHHISEDVEVQLETNVRKARSIMRELDFACNADNYFFGHLLQALQLTEAEALQAVHRLLHSGELNRVNDFKEYQLIRKRCGDFAGCDTDAAKLQRLMQAYGFSNDKEAEQYLESRHVDRKILFQETAKAKLPSCLVAECVLHLWEKKVHGVGFPDSDTGDGGTLFDAVVMNELVKHLVETSALLDLETDMQTAIAPYVNVNDPSSANEHLVADILAGRISEFVVNFGYDLLGPGAIANARETAKKYLLPAFDYIERECKSTYDEDELSALFDDMNTGASAITPAFDDTYNSWTEYMIVSYVAHIGSQGFDTVANHQLTELLQSIKSA